MDTLFKAAPLSVLDDSIVDSYMLFDSGKDMWAALGGSSGSRYVERPMHPPSINA